MRKSIVEILIILAITGLPLLLLHGYVMKSNMNRISGYAFVSSRAFIYMKYNAVCLTRLHAGWNLAGFACEVENSSVESVLNTSRVISVHHYDINNQTDHWKAFKAGLPAWVIQDLDVINPEEGYWVKVNESMEVLEYGNLTLPRIVQLTRGWNMKGFPQNRTKDADEVFNNTAAIESVWRYLAEDNNDHWKVYYPSNPNVSDLHNISPEAGYWIRTTNDTEWVIRE